MKKIILGCCMLFAGLTAAAQNSYKVVLENKAQNSNFNPEKVYLFSIDEKVAIDSASCVNGIYTMQGKAKLPQLASICGTANGYNVVAAFILDGEDIRVTIDKGISLEGSVANTKMQTITKAIEECGMKLRGLQMEAGELSKKYNDQLPDSVAQRLDRQWDEISKRQMDALKNGILANKDNLVPAYFIFNYMEVLGVDFLDNYLSTYKYKDNPLLQSVFKMLEGEKRKAQGVLFSDFEMTDMDGKMHKLSDYAGKGNYVLVDFWASWCGPCRAEMPNVKKAYERFHPKGFEIVGISLDNNAEAWKGAVKQMEMSWPQLSDLKAWKCDAAQLYYVKAIPATILIGPDGKIVATNLRAAELIQKLEEIYK